MAGTSPAMTMGEHLREDSDGGGLFPGNRIFPNGAFLKTRFHALASISRGR